ncbi:MAG: DUF3810 domain-containing protein [Clostridia bacterium]|nr:DUF3810 domain-containing protein [Clostridia bacterium]
MKEILKLKRLYLLLLFPLSGILVLAARLQNAWVEKAFIPFFYKPLSAAVGLITSAVPFSVTEMLIVLAAAFFIYYIIKNYKKPLRILVNLVCTAAVLLFLFELCMGLNYYRYEAKEYLDLDIRESSKQELFELCTRLANDMNVSRAKLTEDENGVAKLSDKNRGETSESARDAYRALSEDYPFLKAYDIKNKPLLSSRLFSYFMTTGIYIPYTFESNINVDVPEHTIPATMCHELTHYRGFMRENEANFLGYLACMRSERADFRYSASLMAFEYAYPKLHAEDAELAKKVAQTLSDGILRDLGAQDEYWSEFEKTITSEVSDKVYDGYLNANGVQSGTKSYGEMVDLLLAYYRS